jgi:predicted negative regulator of RcsB-dependent stress response
VVVIGFQGWNWYQRNQSAQAAGIYEALVRSLNNKDAALTKTTVGELVQNYSGTPYAALGALLAARAAGDGGDLKTAQTQLQWVVDHAKDEVRDLGRLRLAAVLLDQKDYEGALKLVDSPAVEAFAVRFAEMRGDIFFAQGKPAEARGAYQIALDKLAATAKAAGEKPEAARNNVGQQILQQKFDMLGAVK